MKTATVSQMRALDRRTIDEKGISGEALMDRAGRGLAHVVRRCAGKTEGRDVPLTLFAGKGNNGGDVFAAARYLKEWGHRVEVWLAAEAADLQGDAVLHWMRMKAVGVSYREASSDADWTTEEAALSSPTVLVDGLLGTGACGAPRGVMARAIALINRWSENALVVAVDIPSGINGDTGRAEGQAVVADITVTMGLPKKGLILPPALPYVGSVEVVDIGIPEDYVNEMGLDASCELICPASLRPLFSRRARISHKGEYGHALLLGGAQGYAGAITMAAQAAVHSGAGLVSAWVPEGIAPVVSASVLEAMVRPVAETDLGSLAVQVTADLCTGLNDFDALLIGPGLTRQADSKEVVRAVIEQSRIPVVMDADAISVFAGEATYFRKAQCPLVLTPHPGELAALLGMSVEAIQADRFGAARAAAEATEATVILKGAGTIIAGVGHPVCVNLTGNPGMATGGSGDVLAGLLVGLVAQGLDVFDAACLAVYLHGIAGDQVAERTSQAGLSATELIKEIPRAFRAVFLR